MSFAPRPRTKCPLLSKTTAVTETTSTATSSVNGLGGGWAGAWAGAAGRPGRGLRGGGPAGASWGLGACASAAIVPARARARASEAVRAAPIKRPPPGSGRRRSQRDARYSVSPSSATTSTGTSTASTKRAIEMPSSMKLRSGLASPPVVAVDAARSADFAAWGTSAEGAPTAVPRTIEVSGSDTVPRTEAASRAPAAGRSGVPDEVEGVVHGGDLVADELDRGGDREQDERLVRREELERGPEVEHAEAGEAARQEQRQPRAEPRGGGEGDRESERGEELRHRRHVHETSLGPALGGCQGAAGVSSSEAVNVSTCCIFFFANSIVPRAWATPHLGRAAGGERQVSSAETTSRHCGSSALPSFTW